MLNAIKSRLSLKITLTITSVMAVLILAVAVYIIHDQERSMEDLIMDKAKIASTLGAAMYGSTLDEAIDNGVLTVKDVFDYKYEPIKGFNWGDKPRFHTRYDFITDKAILAFQDKFLDSKDFIFAVGVDVNGYLPTHNSKYQLPITGDPGKDSAGNRTKRKFDDPVGKAAAQNTEIGFKQVYFRDTGEVMWDVSSPIYVKGKHWGGFRIGVSIERIQNKKNFLMISLIILFSVFTLIVVGVIYYLVRRATKPIETLSLAADKISMGEALDEKIQSRSTDEIGTLTKSIDRLRVSMKAAMERLGE